MRLTKREKILILLLLLVGGGYLYYTFVFTPEMLKISKLASEQKILQQTLASVNDKENLLPELKQKLAEIQKKKTDMGKGILQPIMLPEILSELEQACLKNGIATGVISFSGDASAVKGDAVQKNSSLQNNVQNPTASTYALNTTTTTAKDKDDKIKALTINITFTASYENLLNLINYYENNTRHFVLQSLDIKGDSTGKCIGSMSISTYSIVSDQDDFLYNAGTELQRTSPF